MTNETTDIPLGRIDVHSHLLMGIDDGCTDFDDVLTTINRLQQFGYVGSICTPHIGGAGMFPMNTPAHIQGWTGQLAAKLQDAGVSYRLWPGGELGIRQDTIGWLQENGVPTMAGSRCVLTDFWDEQWPRWIASTYRWLIDNDYQPILAHPERIPFTDELEGQLDQLTDMGVLLQGNFRSFTGEEGPFADRLARQMLERGQYHLLALDTHRPDSLEPRLDGVQLVAQAFGADRLDEMTITAPRRLIFGLAEAPCSAMS